MSISLQDTGASRPMASVVPWRGVGLLKSAPRLRGLFLRMLAISGALSVLQLATALYVVAVYDRVLPTGDLAALASLTVIVLSLHAAFAIVDRMRARAVSRAGVAWVARFDARIFEIAQVHGGRRALLMLQDLECVRRFLTSSGPCAAFDALWLPVFLTAAAMLNASLGLFALGGVVVLVWLAFSIGETTSEANGNVRQLRRDRFLFLRALCAADDEPAQAEARWRELSRSYADVTSIAHERALSSGMLGKGTRLGLQSLGFGFAAVLFVDGMLTTSALFASTLIFSRTFACADGALTHWTGIVAARASYERLTCGYQSGDARA